MKQRSESRCARLHGAVAHDLAHAVPVEDRDVIQREVALVPVLRDRLEHHLQQIDRYYVMGGFYGDCGVVTSLSYLVAVANDGLWDLNARTSPHLSLVAVRAPHWWWESLQVVPVSHLHHVM